MGIEYILLRDGPKDGTVYKVSREGWNVVVGTDENEGLVYSRTSERAIAPLLGVMAVIYQFEQNTEKEMDHGHDT